MSGLNAGVGVPPLILLEADLRHWLREDLGRGDRTTQALLGDRPQLGKAIWVAKQPGVVAGLPIAAAVFRLVDPTIEWTALVAEGERCDRLLAIATLAGPLAGLLMGERVALNLVMRLSGIATLTRQYVEAIADLPAKFVDTRKTTPGLRLLEKYASQVGGATNHRLGLDDAVMLKDNHIAAAGGIGAAITQVRDRIPYPLTIEVETTTLAEVTEALEYGANTIMLDNMTLPMMREAVALVRQENPRVKLEASGNITLETLRSVAETGVDYISSSAPVTRSHWLDLSMRIDEWSP